MTEDREGVLRETLTAGMADALTKDWPGDTRLSTAPAIVDYLLRRDDVRAALAQPGPRETGLDLEWFVNEVVAYYKTFDHHDVWRESGARALGKWLSARAALSDTAETGGEAER